MRARREGVRERKGETKRKVEKEPGEARGKREKVADRVELARGGNKSHLFFLLVFFSPFFHRLVRERREVFGPALEQRDPPLPGIHHCDFLHV